MNSLARFVAYPEIDSGSRPLKLRALLSDYTALLEETQIIGSDILTLVAFIFIPLNFATSFFGMNIEQLGNGKLHIGYFFLLAALASGLSFALSSMVKPLEAAWLWKRKRFVLREYEDDDKALIASITKRQIFWAFVGRHFPAAEALHGSWEDARYNLSEELGRTYVDPEELLFFSILRYICRNNASRLSQRLRNPRLFAAEPATNAQQDGPEARNTATLAV